ncbi:MAG TPA: hypothetical protein VM076_22640 [Gemmatimonadaceae bacterium]|nr:hypothetical protein [Gemmatimonadaceae bacterium]
MSKGGNPSNSDERESNYSGKLGERNRNTPGRTPTELGLDPEEMRGHSVVGGNGGRTNDVDLTGMEGTPTERQNPPLTEGVDGSGEGGLSMSGGHAGGARGHGGRSDDGAGDPDGGQT